jgi:hypothetical protein
MEKIQSSPSTSDSPIDVRTGPRLESNVELKSCDRVRRDGEYREFSEDGCYVGPYFR